MNNIDWHEILTNKDASEKLAADILTSLSFLRDAAPPFPILAASSSVPSLYGKHMMKKYFQYGNEIERPDIQSEKLDLGIEVTRLVDEQLAIDMKTIDKANIGAKNTEEFKDNIKALDRKGLFKHEIRDVGVGRIIDFDTTNILGVVKNRIIEKINLLPDYKKYNEYWLFMISLAYVPEDGLQRIIKEADNNCVFSTYILLSAANNGEIWFMHEPDYKIEKRFSLGVGGIRNE